MQKKRGVLDNAKTPLVPAYAVRNEGSRIPVRPGGNQHDPGLSSSEGMTRRPECLTPISEETGRATNIR